MQATQIACSFLKLLPGMLSSTRSWTRFCLVILDLFSRLALKVWFARAQAVVSGSVSCQSKPGQFFSEWSFILRLYPKTCSSTSAWLLDSESSTSMFSAFNFFTLFKFDIFCVFAVGEVRTTSAFAPRPCQRRRPVPWLRGRLAMTIISCSTARHAPLHASDDGAKLLHGHGPGLPLMNCEKH